jgi:hypothetical protein
MLDHLREIEETRYAWIRRATTTGSDSELVTKHGPLGEQGGMNALLRCDIDGSSGRSSINKV